MALLIIQSSVLLQGRALRSAVTPERRLHFLSSMELCWDVSVTPNELSLRVTERCQRDGMGV
jgi:hypothetical protein